VVSADSESSLVHNPILPDQCSLSNLAEVYLHPELLQQWLPPAHLWVEVVNRDLSIDRGQQRRIHLEDGLELLELEQQDGHELILEVIDDEDLELLDAAFLDVHLIDEQFNRCNIGHDSGGAVIGERLVLWLELLDFLQFRLLNLLLS
jgi:hypothetical protein